jgi:acetyl esterase/lipase
MRRPFAFALLVLASVTVPGWAADEPSFSRQEDVIYGRKFGTALTMDVFRPKQDSNGLGVIWVVSGGWVSDHGWVNAGYPKVFLDRGYTVFAVVHGCQPKFTIPEVIGDMKRSVRFIKAHAKEYGIDPDRLGVTGGSAGGHLSLILGTSGEPGNPSAKDPVDRESSKVAAVACFYPPTDFLNYGKPGEDAIGRGILQGYSAPFDFREFDPSKKKFVTVTEEAKIVELGKSISPINHVSADDAPTLISHGDADKLVPIQQAEIIVEKLKAAGVDAKLVVKPGGGHGWPGQDKDLITFADWFDAHLKKPADSKSEAPIPAAQAKDHIGERATVEMTVAASKNAEKRLEYYLDSEPNFSDEKNFCVVIGYDHAKPFADAGIANPAEHYKGKTLRVTGTIIRENEQTRIRVEDPGQIKIVE